VECVFGSVAREFYLSPRRAGATGGGIGVEPNNVAAVGARMCAARRVAVGEAVFDPRGAGGVPPWLLRSPHPNCELVVAEVRCRCARG
jgi:hypothetical protein